MCFIRFAAYTSSEKKLPLKKETVNSDYDKKGEFYKKFLSKIHFATQ